jgi:signal transduction histidine kinase
VILSAEELAHEATIEVKNFGAPIPQEMQQVIFNPLVQLSSPEGQRHDRPSTSMGLGLFIVREIVTAHGGAISVSSSASTGTSFVIRLPLR